MTASAREKLGWTPRTPFATLVKEMVEAAKRDSLVKQAGYRAFDYHE